jgi:hypothetical protein
MNRVVYLPAVNKRVSLAAYVVAIKIAKAQPNKEFKHGLDCWWSCTGAEIVAQFREGMQHRINEGIPAILRGQL